MARVIIVKDPMGQVSALEIAVKYASTMISCSEKGSKGINLNLDKKGNLMIPVSEEALNYIEKAKIAYENPII